LAEIFQHGTTKEIKGLLLVTVFYFNRCTDIRHLLSLGMADPHPSFHDNFFCKSNEYPVVYPKKIHPPKADGF
jgi:hypothetical protein